MFDDTLCQLQDTPVVMSNNVECGVKIYTNLGQPSKSVRRDYNGAFHDKWSNVEGDI